MASFSATLHVEGRTYVVVWCQYSFWRYVDRRGRPISQVLKGPIFVELDSAEDLIDLKAWAASDTKIKSGRIVFLRADAESTSHVWFQNAFCVNYLLDFRSDGLRAEGSLRQFFTISPQDMGEEAGNGEDWVPPLPREYAYKPVAANIAAAPTGPPVVSPEVLAGPKPPKNTPEGVAWRWARYQKENAGKPDMWGYERWYKQYTMNQRNVAHGLAEEAAYRQVMGGVSKTLKTGFTQRQIDIYIEDEEYCGQLKTGKINLNKQAKIDLQKDKWLIDNQMTVEYILEKGASKPMLEALNAIGASVKIGRQIP